MDTDRLRCKIRKLLALAESATGPEAASAATLASRLMAEHNLRPEDLGEAPPYVILVEGRGWPVWRRALLTFAAQSNESVALFRRGKRQVSEASLRGVRAGVERSLSYYLELVRVAEEVGGIIAPLAARLMDLEPWTGPRRATDSVRRGVAYGLVRLQSGHLKDTEVAADKATLSDPRDFKTQTHRVFDPAIDSPVSRLSGRVADPRVADPLRPEDGVLAKIAIERWEPMTDPTELFDAASEDLFDLGRRAAEGLVEVDEAGYMKVVCTGSLG